jgi:hypothetical protein
MADNPPRGKPFVGLEAFVELLRERVAGWAKGCERVAWEFPYLIRIKDGISPISWITLI